MRLRKNCRKVTMNLAATFSDNLHEMRKDFQKSIDDIHQQMKATRVSVAEAVADLQQLDTFVNVNLIENIRKHDVGISALDKKISETDTLTKNVERELNQFRNTIVPQISELSLMISNGDIDVKKSIRRDMDKLKQDITYSLKPKSSHRGGLSRI